MDRCALPGSSRLAALALLAFSCLPAGASMFAVAAARAGASATTESAEDASTGVPDDATLEANGALIGEIVVKTGDIFDPEKPGEGNFVFRAANKLHINTREKTVRQLILFKSGDPYSRRTLEESERMLRATGYLYDASIRPLRYDGERVSVLVETRDVWTLGVGLGFGRSGGKNTTNFGIQDRNFLGTGKGIAVERKQDLDRTQTLFHYRDTTLLGTRMGLYLWHSNLSDGKSTRYSLARPFYSLSTRWALGASGETDDRVESIYSAGDVASQFRHEATRGELYGGISRGLANGCARRLLFGFSYAKERFTVPTGLASSTSVLPADRTLSYPWIGFEQVTDGYFTARDMDKIQRTEDHNLGREIHAKLGFSSPTFGGDRNRVIYQASISQGLNPGNEQMLFLNADLSGRLESEGTENLRLSGGARYFVRNMGENMFFVSFAGDLAHDLDVENQLLLGGDNGLRGYPIRYQDGDRRVRLKVEQRFYMPWHILKLVHVGAAVFYDAGAAWWAGDASATGRPLLQDVGFGLRLSSSRSAQGGMVHVDVAFPISPPAGVSRYQISVVAGETF